jgi:hypothetical protein
MLSCVADILPISGQREVEFERLFIKGKLPRLQPSGKSSMKILGSALTITSRTLGHPAWIGRQDGFWTSYTGRGRLADPLWGALRTRVVLVLSMRRARLSSAA